MKRFSKFIFITVSVFGLSFAALADKDLGMVKVIAVKKEGDINYKPDTTTVEGTLIGAGTGAAAGAVIGVAGVVGGLVVTAPTVIGPLAVIAASPIMIGGPALIGAGIGAVIGTGSGYIYGLHEEGLGVFKITVQSDKPNSKPVTFHQNLKNNIKSGQNVELMENDVCWFVPDGNYIKQ